MKKEYCTQSSVHKYESPPQAPAAAAFGPLSGSPARQNLGRLHRTQVDWIGSGRDSAALPQAVLQRVDSSFPLGSVAQ